ncbi:MAG: peptide ABC transporter substrate-binding protein [Deltaproteobacteria bacterium]|nr:peptide ABC transporter substrate-binding protein [Deltaproteobacteria bacterium]
MVPKVAESWSVTPDGTTYTFKIRRNLLWSDGKPVTAHDFVYSWQRLLDPKTAARYAYFLFPIKNAKAFNDTGSRVKDFAQVGAKAVDDYTLVVTLEKAMSYFPTLLTHSSTFPMRKDVVEKLGDKWTEPGNIVTNGPFLLEEWQHNYKLTLVRNDNYWGEKAKLRRIVGYMITEESSSLNLYETGKLDIMRGIPTSDIQRLKNTPDYYKIPLLAAYYYGFNVNKPPFNDPNVRKAFSAAIDREEICKALQGDQIPLTSWIPKGMLGYNPNVGIKFDPDKAVAYLKQAGYEKGDPRLQGITLAYNTNEGHKQVAENLQALWQKHLGVKVNIDNQEWKVFLDILHSIPAKPLASPHLFRMGWVGDYPDPDNFMNLFTSGSDNNHTGWKNSHFDKLIERAAVEIDPDVRLSLYNEAQRVLTEEEVPILPIYVYTTQKLIKPYVKGFQLNPLDEYYLDTIWVEAGS